MFCKFCRDCDSKSLDFAARMYEIVVLIESNKPKPPGVTSSTILRSQSDLILANYRIQNHYLTNQCLFVKLEKPGRH